MSTTLTIILWMLMGAATAYLAYQRGRDPYIWFVIGMFFGLLAMLVLVFLPPVKIEEKKMDLKNEEIVERREKQMEEQEKLESAPDLQPQSIETKEWFYLDKTHQQQGPFSFYIINELWENGEINAHSLVWTEGMAEWKKIEDTENLYKILQDLESESRKTFPEDL